MHAVLRTQRRVATGGLLLVAALVLAAGALAQELPPVPGAGEARSAEMERAIEGLDPGAEGWDTEVLNDQAGTLLAALGEAIAHSEQADEASLAQLLSADFRCAPLRPEGLEPVFEGPALRVLHPAARDEPPELARGAAGLARALRALAQPFEGGHHVSTKFKVFSVEPDPAAGRYRTRVYYLAYGDPPAGYLQQNATWVCDWVRGDGDAPARLAGIEVEAYEEVVGPAGGGQLYADCSEAVLGANAAWSEQLLPNLETWLATLQASVFNNFEGHHGLALGDVDGDGLEDVYVCQPGGLPNLLFVQQPDGTAREVAGERGLDFLEACNGALLVDLDEDGDLDLALGVFPELVLLENDGRGRFREAHAVQLPDLYSLAAADADGDGDLDLYCCSYKIVDGSGRALPVPYHDSNNGFPNTFLRNEGAWRFSDATVASGLDQNNRRFSFAAAWEDYDEDGDPDLYVANDFGRNNLYRNDGGRFTDVAAEAGVEDISAGMGVTWGDYDGDGLMDLYVSNMFSSAGGRIAYQRRFQPGADESMRQGLQRHARGNSLFRNTGDGTFRDVSVEAGVTMGRWAWGSLFVDLDNDGWEDLFVPNGFATSEQSKDL